jgi:hypothetical protein
MTMETVIRQSAENMAYVRRLLRRKHPGYSAALEWAVALAVRELRPSGPITAEAS